MQKLVGAIVQGLLPGNFICGYVSELLHQAVDTCTELQQTRERRYQTVTLINQFVQEEVTLNTR